MMTSCHACEGFVPANTEHCPHCDAPAASPRPSRVLVAGKRALQVAGAAAVAVTLMACYGAISDYDDGHYDDGGDPYCEHGQDAYGECNDPPQPETCGNGVVDGDEACDDGGQSSGDGCSADCAVELCAGATPLALGLTDGSTGAAESSALFHTQCGDFYGYGRERVYAYTPDQHGTLSVSVSGGMGLYATYQCNAVNSVDTAFPDTGETVCAPPDEVLDVPVLAGQLVYLVVDAPEPDQSGSYTLDAAFTPGCGDGVLQGYAHESCDAGLAEEGKAASCDEGCSLLLPAHCEGAPSLSVGSHSGTTANGIFASQGPGCDGNDDIVSFTAPSDGSFLAVVQADFDASLKLLDGCTTASFGSQACTSASPAGEQEVAARVLSAGETVWLVVDGTQPEQAGSYELLIDFVAAQQP